MILGDVFSAKAIKVNLESESKDEVFEELVEELVAVQNGMDRRKVLGAIRSRESLMSTGIMHGIAIPHGKTDAVSGVIGAIGVSQAGIEYDSLDKSPVHLVFLLVSSPEDSECHLQALKRLALVLEDPSFYESLLAQQTPQGVYDTLCKYEVMHTSGK